MLFKLYLVSMLRGVVCCTYSVVLSCHVINASSHCLQEEKGRFEKVCTKYMLVKVLHVVYQFIFFFFCISGKYLAPIVIHCT